MNPQHYLDEMESRTGAPRSFKEQVVILKQRFEHWIPLVSFIGGFTYDSFTLTRIDLWLDDMIMLGYLVIGWMAIVLSGRIDRGGIRHGFFINHQGWIAFALHFCMGGLFSAYTLFYFRSAAVPQAYIFVLLIIVIWVVNDFIPERISKIKLLSALHFFCSFAFFTFFLPVMTHAMDFATFLKGGYISLGVTALMWVMIYGRNFSGLSKNWKGIVLPPGVLFLALVGFYNLNWIPPVPLALKDSGIFREITRLDDGRFQVRYRQPYDWELFKKDDTTFYYTPGDTVYCFTSVFAPTEMSQKIVHHWQRKNEEGNWLTTDRIGYAILGGRDGGWRGYTMKRRILPGDWRIDVEAEDGRVLGRIPLKVYPAKQAIRDMVYAYR